MQVIRITPVPRVSHQNSGLQALWYAKLFSDVVWAAPGDGPFIDAYASTVPSIFDSCSVSRFFNLRTRRLLFLLEIFSRAVKNRSDLFIVHSFVFAIPVALLGKPFVIFIHGSDRRHLSTQWGGWVARRARRILGVGFEERGDGFLVEEVKNIFRLTPSMKEATPIANVNASDVLFVLRNAPVKNPVFPISLAEAVVDRRLAIKVAGVSFDELSENDRVRLEKVNRDGHSVEYLGRVSYEDVIGLMSSSRLLVVPSHSEGIPKVVLEAMNQGLRVLMNRKLNVPTGLEAHVELFDLSDYSKIVGMIDVPQTETDRDNLIQAVRSYLESAEAGLLKIYNEIYDDAGIRSAGMTY